MDNLDNFVEILLNEPIGTSTWNWVKKEPTSGFYFIPVVTDSNYITTDYQPMFVFKLAPRESFSLGEQVKVQFRAGCFKYKNVVTVYILFVFPGIDFIHEVWINHYTAFDDATSPLFRLQEMKNLTLLFYETNQEPKRIIKIANTVDWANIIYHVQKSSPWSDAQFDAAKAAAPSADVLWNL